MSATEELIEAGPPLAQLASIRVAGNSTLAVTWKDGSRAGRRDVLDLTPLIGSYKIYRPLRGNPALFRTARLVEDGYVVVWDGPDLEMTAELMETLAEQSMTPDDFARFIARNGLTHDAAAALLGRSRRQIEYYLRRGPIPRVVALACFGYEAFAARQRSEAA